MDDIKFLPLDPALEARLFPKEAADQKVPPDHKAESSAEKLSELQAGAKAFESYFVQSLLKEMRKSVASDRQGGEGMGKPIYTSMFDQAISEKITESGGIGLSKLLVEKLSRSLQFSARATDKIKE